MDKVYILKNIKTNRVECVFLSINGCLKHLENHFNDCDHLNIIASHNKSYKGAIDCENFEQVKEVFENHINCYLTFDIRGITEYKYEIRCTDFINE